MDVRRSFAALATGVLVAAAPGSVLAETESESAAASDENVATPLQDQTLTGSDSLWDVGYTPAEADTDCLDGYTDAGFNLDDAETPSSGDDDAFDEGHQVDVNDSGYNPGSASTDGTSFVTGDPQTLDGLEVTSSYTAFASNDVLRWLVTFTNNGTAPVTADIGIGHDVGSDEDTIIAGDSGGNGAVDLTDTWFVSAEDADDPDDPSNTFVVQGSDDPATTRTPLGPNEFDPDCFDDHIGADPNTSNDEYGPRYPLTVSTGATCSLLFFNAIAPADSRADVAAAVTAAPGLQATAAGSPLLDGLDAATVANVVNWDLAEGDGSCAPVDAVLDPGPGPDTGPVAAAPGFTG